MAFVHCRDMEVFKRAYALALDIHRVSASFPKDELFGGMASQMRRASKSICANLAEGLGKSGSKIEQARFLRIAFGSNDEMQVWFLFCRDLTYIEEQCYARWSDEAGQIGRMIYSLIEKRAAFHSGKVV